MSAPKTHAAAGRVKLVGGDVRHLAGGHVEAVRADDLSVQAAGEIADDGRFALGVVRAGKTLPGVPEGDYRLRVVLSDEDSGHRLRRGRVIAPRFGRYQESGLRAQVPTTGDLELVVSAK